MYPDVQAKAQAEVDRVTGGSRLPNSGDRARLPYIMALYKEVGQLNTLKLVVILIFLLSFSDG
jgi:hypothetical protein